MRRRRLDADDDRADRIHRRYGSKPTSTSSITTSGASESWRPRASARAGTKLATRSHCSADCRSYAMDPPSNGSCAYFSTDLPMRPASLLLGDFTEDRVRDAGVSPAGCHRPWRPTSGGSGTPSRKGYRLRSRTTTMAKSLKLEVARAHPWGRAGSSRRSGRGVRQDARGRRSDRPVRRWVDNGREVLLLTQTNAARNVSADRLRDSGARAQTQTLDSLAARLSGDTCATSNLRSLFVPASSTALSSSSGRRPPQVLRGR